MTQMAETRDRATSDPAERGRVLERIKEEGVDFILLWFTDLEGHLKSFAITPARDRERARRRHGLRRLVDHRLQRHRGVGHGRDPRPDDVPAHAVLGGRPLESGADDLRRRHARRRAVRGRPALRAATRRRAHARDGLRHVQHRAGARVLPLQERRRPVDPRRGRLLRADDARRGNGAAPGDDPRARVDGHPRRVRAPRGRAVPARDRRALRGRARHGRPRAHVPADREGDRGEERRLRDVHAEADLRRERIGHAHAPVAVHRRPQRVLRRGRQVAPLRRRQGVHRRPARGTRARSPASSPSG